MSDWGAGRRGRDGRLGSRGLRRWRKGEDGGDGEGEKECGSKRSLMKSGVNVGFFSFRNSICILILFSLVFFLFFFRL